MSDKNKEKRYQNIEVKDEDNMVEITGEVKADIFDSYKEKALKLIQKDFEADGFRKGKVPLDVVKEKLGEDRILNEAAQQALNDIYPELVKEQDFQIMSRPQVQITKIASGNPLGFKITVGTVPEVKLPAYKDIAKSVKKEISEEKKETEEVSDEEVDQVIKYIQSQHAAKNSENEDDEAPKVPELNEDFVKELGDFESVDEFKKQMKENLKKEKENQSRQNVREKIAERLVEETDIKLPEITVKTQLGSRLERLQQSLDQRDMSFDEYLENIEKDEEGFIKEEKKMIENQLKTRLIFEKIAEEEDLKADEKELEQQLKAMQQYQPDANPEALKSYIETSLVNKKVMDLLEGKEEDKS